MASTLCVDTPSDHEPHSRQYALGTGTMSEQDRRHIEFMPGADLAIHDAQYTTERVYGQNRLGTHPGGLCS